MTDAAIADTLNRHAAQLIARQLDSVDRSLALIGITPWAFSPIAETLMGENATTSGDRAWLVGLLAARTPGLDFDGPADADWENLISHLRAEILARRGPRTPSVREADSVRDGVGSR